MNIAELITQYCSKYYVAPDSLLHDIFDLTIDIEENYQTVCKAYDAKKVGIKIISELEAENEALKSQVEKMKCCGNCQWQYSDSCADIQFNAECGYKFKGDE